MSDSTSETNQFLMLEFLRHQLDEVFEATNTEFIRSLTKELGDMQVAPGESVRIKCKIGVVNVGSAVGKPKYVVEELCRLSSAVLALTNTINHMGAKVTSVSNGDE